VKELGISIANLQFLYRNRQDWI